MSEDIKLNKNKIADICKFIIENDIFALELRKTKRRKKKVIKDE